MNNQYYSPQSFGVLPTGVKNLLIINGIFFLARYALRGVGIDLDMYLALYPVQTPWGIELRNIPVEIDEPLLRDIASQTGGRYFRATDNTKLSEIYAEIGQMEKSRITVDSFPVYKELFMWPALAALACLVLELLLRIFIRRMP